MRRRFDRSIDRFLNSQASISLDYPVLRVLYNSWILEKEKEKEREGEREGKEEGEGKEREKKKKRRRRLYFW
jgi:hypothetical protein